MSQPIFEISGRVKAVLDAKTFASGFTVREFVIAEDGGKYAQEIIFQVIQDKVSLLDNVQVDDEVEVAFNIMGREHNGRWFNNLQAWKIQVAGGRNGAPPVEGQEPYEDPDIPEDEEDDIPF